MISTRKQPKQVIFIGLCLIVVALVGCMSQRSLVKVINVSAFPDPIVGQVVTLRVEVLATVDGTDARIDIVLPDEINLVAGDLTWYGDLTANQPQVHEISICVLQPGIWRIATGTHATFDSKRVGSGDGGDVYVESTANSGRIMSVAEYSTIRPRPATGTATPTPVPFHLSPECLANPK